MSIINPQTNNVKTLNDSNETLERCHVTAIELAITNNHLDVVQYLFHIRKVPVSCEMLCKVIKNNFIDIFKFLLILKCTDENADDVFDDMIAYAIYCDNLDTIRILLDISPNPNPKGQRDARIISKSEFIFNRENGYEDGKEVCRTHSCKYVRDKEIMKKLNRKWRI